MNTYYLSALDEQFKYECKVINLSYEYPGYTGKEKWAIITDLTEINRLFFCFLCLAACELIILEMKINSANEPNAV